MHYCEAGDLEKMLSLRRRLSEGETRYIAQQLLSAIQHMHIKLGVLHGDIKCANIVFAVTADSDFPDFVAAISGPPGPGLSMSSDYSTKGSMIPCKEGGEGGGGGTIGVSGDADEYSANLRARRINRASSEADFQTGDLFGE